LPREKEIKGREPEHWSRDQEDQEEEEEDESHGIQAREVNRGK
jgi:hypothetical protein